VTTLARPLHLLAAGAAASALLLAGCGSASETIAEKATEQAIESQGGGDVDINTDGDGSVSIETEDGSFSSDGEGNVNIETEDGSMSSSGDVPDAWPDDVPIPDGTEVQMGSDFDSADGRLVSVTGITTASPDEVLDLYKDALSDWEISGEVTSTSNGSSTTSAQFDTDGRRFTFFATDSTDGTTVNLGHTTLS
jgi:hypothetical protein